MRIGMPITRGDTTLSIKVDHAAKNIISQISLGPGMVSIWKFGREEISVLPSKFVPVKEPSAPELTLESLGVPNSLDEGALLGAISDLYLVGNQQIRSRSEHAPLRS